jgi:hypothetical protein
MVDILMLSFKDFSGRRMTNFHVLAALIREHGNLRRKHSNMVSSQVRNYENLHCELTSDA